MGDGFWNRQLPLRPLAGLLKRPRPDYDLPPSGLTSSHELHNYLARDDDRGGLRAVSDTKQIGSAYDRYLQSVKLPSLTSVDTSSFSGVGLGRVLGGRIPGLSTADPELPANGRSMGFGGQQLPMDVVSRAGHETAPLPPDASNTLYVEGLPPDSTKREVAHIFRPFVGYKEVRLVTKESKHRGGDPLILCFVDFIDPACAATALSALQGYKMDESNPDSSFLRLQFSRFPGPRSGPGHRGKR